MTYRSVASKPRKLGCEEIPRCGGGSHRTWRNPQTNKLTVIPDWGSKDLKMGTLRAIIRQLGLDWNRFNNVD